VPERVGHAPGSIRLSAVYSDFIKRTAYSGRKFNPKRATGLRSHAKTDFHQVFCPVDLGDFIYREA